MVSWKFERLLWLAGACLLGGWIAAAVVSGLRPAVALQTPAANPGDVVINEVAWGGTDASSADEWIELYNTTAATVSLNGWCLTNGDNLNIALSGGIPPSGYYLIERTDDNAVSDISADWFGSFGTGGLLNSGAVLTLTDNLDNVMDTANADGGEWPAGTASTGTIAYATMERIDPTALGTDANWCTNDGVTRNGKDANGDPINGTPKAQNSCYQLPTGPVADLSVSKSGPISVEAGDPITYRIALRNTGAITATGVLLTDTLPVGIDFITQTSDFPFTQTTGALVWDVGDVFTGALHVITVTGYVTDAVTGALTNRVTATTVTSETASSNNHAVWETEIKAGPTTYFPLVLRNYTPPPYWVIIEAALYDGWQANDLDEAVLLLNGGDEGVDLTGWELCKMGSAGWSCADLPSVEIASHQRLWLARNEAGFADSFGFDPDHVLSGWPVFNNDGSEVVLLDAEGAVRDALVYEEGDETIVGWDGPAVQPYGGSNFAVEGQVLYRYPDEETSLPSDDTNTASDWAQHADDSQNGRRVRYPGWDLERFFRPALGASGTVTVGIAPDNAHQVAVDAIRSAKERIELEVYTLEQYGIVTELVQQAQQGVSVTVLLEGGPVGGVEDQELWACEQLHETGHGLCYFLVTSDTLRIHNRYSYAHAKFMVVDRKRLLISSQNLTPHGLPGDDKSNGTGGSRGVVLTTDAPEMVARAVEIFEADCDPENHADVSLWGPDNVLGYGSPPPDFVPDTGEDWMTYTVQFPQPLATTGDWFELVTAPESALRSSDALLGLMARAGAGDGVYVEQLYEHPDWGDPVSAPNLRLQAYVEAARRGARVRILLNGGTLDLRSFSLTSNVEAAAYVNEIAQAEGLDLSAHLGDPTQYGIHNKMVLVDLGAEGKYVHVGSINGSETSNKVNREMALQVRSAALFDCLYEMFDYDWNYPPPLDRPLISEVMYRPNDPLTGNREWIEIYNPTAEDITLSGWYLGDVGPKGEYGSGLYRFPTGVALPAGGVIVVAQQAADVDFAPDYEFLIDPKRNDPSVPDMVSAGKWDGFGFALGNAGDEVLLLDASGAAIDVVVYGAGSFPGVIPHPGVASQGSSLERYPPEWDSDDCSQDLFECYPPTPGALPE
jgi:uncharacterized repeat protein (TIGR01451 family)